MSCNQPRAVQLYMIATGIIIPMFMLQILIIRLNDIVCTLNFDDNIIVVYTKSNKISQVLKSPAFCLYAPSLLDDATVPPATKKLKRASATLEALPGVVAVGRNAALSDHRVDHGTGEEVSALSVPHNRKREKSIKHGYVVLKLMYEESRMVGMLIIILIGEVCTCMYTIVYLEMVVR